MKIHYLETLTLEVPFRYIISFFGGINFQSMSSLVYTVYCQKQPSEWRRSVKKGVLNNFVNFIGKHLCWSLFLITLQVWHLFWRTSANDCFCTALASLIVRERSFLMSGTRAEGNCPGYENLAARIPGYPRPGYENMFNNLSKRPRGAKTVEQFFTGY